MKIYNANTLCSTHFEIEGARVAKIQNGDFSNTKGQLTPQSEGGSGRNSNSS